VGAEKLHADPFMDGRLRLLDVTPATKVLPDVSSSRMRPKWVVSRPQVTPRSGLSTAGRRLERVSVVERMFEGMDHFSGADQAHPLRRMTAQVSALVKEAADVDPIFMSPADKTAALAELTLLQDQLRLIELGVARTCGDLAAQAGHRDVASWRAAEEKRDRRAGGPGPAWLLPPGRTLRDPVGSAPRGTVA
jgi:hypothetical protein